MSYTQISDLIDRINGENLIIYDNLARDRGIAPNLVKEGDSDGDYTRSEFYKYKGAGKSYVAGIERLGRFSGSIIKDYAALYVEASSEDYSNLKFVAKGGGVDDGYAQIKFCRRVVDWEKAINAIAASFGVSLNNKTISKEAIDYVKNVDIDKLKNGYYETLEDGSITYHEPYEVQNFNEAIDNIYVNMALSLARSNFCKKNGLLCFVDYKTNKMYCADSALTRGMHVMNSAGAFNFTNDMNMHLKPGAWTAPVRPFDRETDGMKESIAKVLNMYSNNYVFRIKANYPGNLIDLSFEYTSPNLVVDSPDGIIKPNTFYSVRATDKIYRVRAIMNYNTGEIQSIESNEGNSPDYYRFRIKVDDKGDLILAQYTQLSQWNDANGNLGTAAASTKVGNIPSDFSGDVSSNYSDWEFDYVRTYFSATDKTENVTASDFYNDIKIMKFAASKATQQEAQAGTEDDNDIRPGDDADDTSGSKEPNEDEGVTEDENDFVNMGGGGFFNVYYTSSSEVKLLLKKVFTNASIQDVVMKIFGGDATSMIASLHRVPFVPAHASAYEPMKIGCYDCSENETINETTITPQGGYPVSNRLTKLDFGTIHISPKFKDQRDYSPVTRCEIYLPFSGIHQIDIDDIMDADVQLIAEVDVVTGAGVYHLKVKRDTMVAELYSFNFSCKIDYPISSNQTNLAGAMTSLSGGIAGALGGIAAAAMSSTGAGAMLAVGGGAMAAASGAAMGTLNAAKNQYARSGNIGDASGWCCILQPYLIINTPGFGDSTNFNEIAGTPSNTDVVLSNVKGFAVIRDIHLNFIDSATQSEKDEIERLLKEGVVF